jgi:hypothetical protein
MSITRRVVAYALGVTVAGAPGLVRAQPLATPPTPASVLIVPPSCPKATPFSVDAFVGILTAELRADGIAHVLVGPTPPGETKELAAIELHAEPCDETASEVIVTIEDHATSKKVERRVHLGDIAQEARPRALALAVAELLRATWLELTMVDAPPPQVPVPAEVRVAVEKRMAAMLPSFSPDAVPSSVPPGARTISVDVAWRIFPSANASMYGGHAAVAVPLFTPSVLLRVDVGALFGSANDALGSVDLGMATGGAALLFASPREAPVAVAVGPRLELGAAWASGNPFDQATSSAAGSGFVSTASVLGTFHFRLTGSWRLAVELEAGASLVPFDARADSRRVTGTDGAMFGVAVGLAQLR